MTISAGAAELVEQYLELLREQKTLSEKIGAVKEQIAAYAEENKLKQLTSGKTTLTVTRGRRTTFPKVNEPGRNEVMKIMYASKEWQNSVNFDIVKLGFAYDSDKLSADLKEKLKPFAKEEPFIRVSTNKV